MQQKPPHSSASTPTRIEPKPDNAQKVVRYGRTWNNPENAERYGQALKQEQKAYQESAKAYGNYDHELGKAQDDVKRVTQGMGKGAIRGAAVGGPVGAAGGAITGAGKGAAEGIAIRGKDYYKERKGK